MRFPVLAILLISASVAHADAYKCKEPNGKLVFSSVPCSINSAQISTVPNSNTTQAEYDRAQSDLDRQKSWLRKRQVEQGSQPDIQLGVVEIEKYGETDRIHACLMAVTAMSRIAPYDAGQRRVNCYRGTKGRSDECEGRVAATPLLTMNQESALKSQCRSM